MDAELLRRIVRVESRFEDADPKLGTGCRVGPGHVLTAQHLVERRHEDGEIERAAEIKVFLDEDGRGEDVEEADAKVLWRGEERLDPGDPKALDAVLLADELPAEDLKPLKDWIEVPLGTSGRWETQGYAKAAADVDALGMEYLCGGCQPARKLARYLKLTTKRRPPLPDEEGEGANWAGLSGAPVFVKEGRYAGWLYGIVRQSPERFEDVLHAVGTPALLREKKLREILAFKQPAPPHVSLVEKLRELLEQDPTLARRLAGLDEDLQQRWRDGGNDDLLDALCREGRLGPMVEHLRELYGREAGKSVAAERLREAAKVLVPILAARELPGGEALTADWTRQARLGTASPSFAEALLASAYGTPCLYEGRDEWDVPRAWLRVPTENLEAGVLAESRISEQLEELLMDFLERDLDKAPFLPRGHKALLSRSSGGKRIELLKKQLRKHLARIEQSRGRPPYLLADEELRKKMGDQLGTFLDRLSAVLPNLAMVVLETGTDNIEKAIDQEDQLWPLWEILDLLPQ